MAGLLVICAEGWGYWFMSTHATLWIWVYDHGRIAERGVVEVAHHPSVEFLDARGNRLASARESDSSGGMVLAQHPSLGSCSPFDPDCMRWSSEWAPRVRYASVKVEGCVIPRVPVRVSINDRGWATWWLPPHIEIPAQSISLQVEVDSRTCSPHG
jgi:hypothetical protein